MQTNNYQGIVVTDGLSTHVIFTYICGEIQWSSLGTNRAAVVGYNGVTSFYNHPLSGFSSIGESISCTGEIGRRQKRQSVGQPTNMAIPLPVDPTLRMLINNCRRAATQDGVHLIGTTPDELASMLEPCPCSLYQVNSDLGRFVRFSNNPPCYLSGPRIVNLPLGRISLTQQCCYDANNGYVHHYNYYYRAALH